MDHRLFLWSNLTKSFYCFFCHRVLCYLYFNAVLIIVLAIAGFSLYGWCCLLLLMFYAIHHLRILLKK